MDFLKTFLSIILISFLTSASFSEELSNSKRLSKFNLDSKERLDWVLSQNKKVNERLKQSSNFKIIEKSYRKKFDTERVIRKEILPDKKVIKLIDRGLGKPQELEVIDGEKKQIVFSTNSLARNNTYNAIHFVLNPSGTKAVIVFDYKGATDGFKFLALDISNKQQLLNNQIISFNGTPESLFFKNDLTLVVAEEESEAMWGLKAYTLDSSKEPYYLFEKAWMGSIMDGWTIIGGENMKTQLISQDEAIVMDNVDANEFLGFRNNYFYFAKSEEKKTQIIRMMKNDPSKIEVVFEAEKNFNITVLLENYIVLQEKWGARRALTSYSLLDSTISNVEVPDYCSVVAINETKEDKTLDVEVASDLISSHHATWDLPNNTFKNLDLLKDQLQSVSSIAIETKYVEVKSFDGTLVPIKLVYKKGLELKNLPAYIESYGGFNSDNYLHPRFDYFNYDFVRHGGIYIGTGLRGGGEFGEEWHQSGALKNKMKTYEDLASVAKWLIDQGISVREKIISAGSSNGGLTVAATGVLYPQYFGLVIPHNGVLDMLAKEELDPVFDHGWSYEYGDSRVSEDYEYIKLFSPLEHVKNVSDGPRFLVINGRNDTRVNPAHSIKFSMAASEAPNSHVELISLNNSGHFNVSIRYNDYIAWRAQVVKWTTVYDFLNIKY